MSVDVPMTSGNHPCGSYVELKGFKATGCSGNDGAVVAVFFVASEKCEVFMPGNAAEFRSELLQLCWD